MKTLINDYHSSKNDVADYTTIDGSTGSKVRHVFMHSIAVSADQRLFLYGHQQSRVQEPSATTNRQIALASF